MSAVVCSKPGPRDFVLASGFHVDRFMRPMKIVGCDGLPLDDVWKKRPSAYLSVGVPGFPNFFLLNGPNSRKEDRLGNGLSKRVPRRPRHPLRMALPVLALPRRDGRAADGRLRLKQFTRGVRFRNK